MTILWDGDPLLPPIGCDVLISHGRDELDHICTVTGYEVQPSTQGSPRDHRVFINLVYKGTNTTNQRLLCDVRPLTKAKSIAQTLENAAEKS
jgi:hypothetical protein